jgi:hypothetical protein
MFKLFPFLSRTDVFIKQYNKLNFSFKLRTSFWMLRAGQTDYTGKLNITVTNIKFNRYRHLIIIILYQKRLIERYLRHAKASIP